MAIHRRLIAGSMGLIKFLSELGYEEIKSIGSGLKKQTHFKKGDRVVITTHYIIELYKKENDKLIIQYKGSSINDELLKYFTKKDIV